MHNGNVIPTNRGYIGVSSAYQAGTSVFDFSRVLTFPPITTPDPAVPPPTVATEIAFFDAKADGRGIDDAWSTYWHNDYVYASSGLASPPPAPGTCCVRPGNRGLDVYLLLDEKGKHFKARNFRYQNPQTQE